MKVAASIQIDRRTSTRAACDATGHGVANSTIPTRIGCAKIIAPRRSGHIALLLLVAVVDAGYTAVAAEHASITIPMNAAADVKKRINSSLQLRVFGYEKEFQIEVTSRRHVHGCFHNLAYAAPHGPDQSGIMPWHVTNAFYPNTRVVSVCGYPFEVVISIASPQIAGEGNMARFVGGTLTATIRRRGEHS